MIEHGIIELLSRWTAAIAGEARALLIGSIRDVPVRLPEASR